MFIFVLGYVIIGMCMGSFLWKLSDGTRMSLTGRSICDHCQKKLSWYELVPLFSWSIQGGKCRSCRNTLLSDYFFSELGSAIVFGLAASIFRIYPMVAQGILLVVLCLLLYCCFYDIKHKELPMVAFLVLLIAMIIFYGVYMQITLSDTLVDQLYISVGLWLGIWCIIRGIGASIYYGKYRSIGQGLGFGDVLFSIPLGLLLPFIILTLGRITGIQGLVLDNWYIRYGGLAIYHMFFSSIGGIIGFVVFKQEEFPFLPYMFGGYVILAIAIYMFYDYFLNVLSF